MKNSLLTGLLLPLIFLFLFSSCNDTLAPCKNKWEKTDDAIQKSYPIPHTIAKEQKTISEYKPSLLERLLPSSDDDANQNKYRSREVNQSHYLRYQYVGYAPEIDLNSFGSESDLIKRLEKCPCDENLFLVELDSDKVPIQEEPSSKEEDFEDSISELMNEDIDELRNYLFHSDPEKQQDWSGNLPFDELKRGLLNLKPSNNAVLIAILDSGVDFYLNNARGPNHINLWDNPDLGACGYRNDFIGWDFVNDDNSPLDDQGHGTAVASIVANTLRESGVNDYQIMTLKTHDENGVGTLFDISCALAYARKHDAKVINMSFGYFGNSSNMLKKAIELAENDAYLIAATGNYQRNIKVDSFFPASFAYEPNIKRLLPVMGYSKKDKTKLHCCSNYPYEQVNPIAAQGQSVRALVPSYFTGSPGGPWTFDDLTGTSYAAPIITAVIAEEIHNSGFTVGAPMPNLSSFAPGSQKINDVTYGTIVLKYKAE